MPTTATLILLLVACAAHPVAATTAARARQLPAPRTPREAYERATEPLREWGRSKDQTLESNIKANAEQERRAREYAPRFKVGAWRGEQLFNLGRLHFIALQPGGTEEAFAAYLRDPSAAELTHARRSLLWALVRQEKWGRAVPIAELLLGDPKYNSDANSYVQLLITGLRAADHDKAVALSEKRLPRLLDMAEGQSNSGLAAAVLKDALELGELYREAGKDAEAEAFINSFLSRFRQSRLGSDKQVTQSVEASIRRVNLLGAQAPPIGGTEYVGIGEVDMAALKGRVVMLDFFAHWCAPCVAGFPVVNSLKAKYEPQGLVIVGVTQYYGFFGGREKLAPADELAALKTLKAERHAEQGFVVGPRANFAAYGISGLPAVALIDRAGKVRAISTGGAASAEVEKLIRTLIAEPAGDRQPPRTR